MRMRVFTKKLRVEIENEMRVFLESLNLEIEMRVSQKSVVCALRAGFNSRIFLVLFCAHTNLYGTKMLA